MPDHLDNDQAIRQEYDYRIRSASTLVQILWEQGVYSIYPPKNRSFKKDLIVSTLDILASCLIRTTTERVAIGTSTGWSTQNSNGPLEAKTQTRAEEQAQTNKEKKAVAAREEEVKLNDLVKSAWVQSAINATNISQMIDVIYRYYGNAEQPRLKGIDLSAYGEVVFTLLQNSLRDAPGSSPPQTLTKDAYIRQMMFHCYVVGMSLTKLRQSLKELYDIKNQTTWLGFRDFLKRPIEPEGFEPQHEKLLYWSQANRDKFHLLLKQAGIVLDNAKKQTFSTNPIEFDQVVAFVFHRLVKGFLERIISYHDNLFLKKGDGELFLQVRPDVFRHRLYHLVLSMDSLAKFIELPKAFELYVQSIKPLPASGGNATGKGATKDEVPPASENATSNEATEDEFPPTSANATSNKATEDEVPPTSANRTSNEATKNKVPVDVIKIPINQIMEQLAIIDEQTEDSGSIRRTKTDQSPLSSNQADGSNGHVGGIERERGGCYAASRWRERYQQWITRILRQFTAIDRLTRMIEKGQLRRIENLKFTSVRTDPTTHHMEDWRHTVERVMAAPVDEYERELAAPIDKEIREIPAKNREPERERILANLEGLRDISEKDEAYKWLDVGWSTDFRGSVHCEATLASSRESAVMCQVKQDYSSDKLSQNCSDGSHDSDVQLWLSDRRILEEEDVR
ncbi:MAG: hypothetical protein Q9180_002135 [Flavoplaca navasiana]